MSSSASKVEVNQMSSSITKTVEVKGAKRWRFDVDDSRFEYSNQTARTIKKSRKLITNLDNLSLCYDEFSYSDSVATPRSSDSFSSEEQNNGEEEVKKKLDQDDFTTFTNDGLTFDD